MTFEEIINELNSKFESSEWTLHTEAKQPFIYLPANELLQVGKELHSNKKLFFDHLACITGVDNGDKEGTIDIIYHFSSLTKGHTFVIKVVVDRNLSSNPSVPTLTPIWKGADWHERECYDFFGVKFTDHPDLRRILLPANWEGHPMRKDYNEQEYYHGIKVKY